MDTNEPIFVDKEELLHLCLLDAHKFAGVRNGFIHVWDWETFENRSFEAYGKINCLEKVSDGHLVSAESVKCFCNKYSYNLYFWKLGKNMSLKKSASITNAHRKDIRCLQMLPMGALASGSSDYVIKIWDKRRKFQRRMKCNGDGNLVCIKFAEPNLIVCGATNGSIRVWEYETGICLKRIQEDNDWINSIVVLSSGFLGCCVYGSVKFHEIEDRGVKDAEMVISSEKTGGIRCIEMIDNERFIGYDIGNIVLFELKSDD